MKITGPLMSQEARGTIADVLTFSKRQSGQQARFQKKQVDAETSGQISQRAKFSNAADACRFLELGEIVLGVFTFGNNSDYNNEKAEGKNLTGYNVCISDYLATS